MTEFYQINELFWKLVKIILLFKYKQQRSNKIILENFIIDMFGNFDICRAPVIVCCAESA